MPNLQFAATLHGDSLHSPISGTRSKSRQTQRAGCGFAKPDKHEYVCAGVHLSCLLPRDRRWPSAREACDRVLAAQSLDRDGWTPAAVDQSQSRKAALMCSILDARGMRCGLVCVSPASDRFAPRTASISHSRSQNPSLDLMRHLDAGTGVARIGAPSLPTDQSRCVYDLIFADQVFKLMIDYLIGCWHGLDLS